MRKTISIFLIIILTTYTQLTDTNNLIYFEKFNYLIILIILFFVLLKKKKLDLFSPAVLLYVYIGLNYFLGSYFFENDLFFDYQLKLLDNNNLRTRILFNNIFFLTTISTIGEKINLKFRLIKNTHSRKLKILYGFLLILIFSKLSLRLDFLGGSGEYSQIPLTLGLLILIVNGLIYVKEVKIRLVVYILTLVSLSQIFYLDKRQAILILLSVLFFEIIILGVNFTFKSLTISFGGVVLSILLIMSMSIKRGYGGFNIENEGNILQTLKLVPEYIQRPLILQSLANNFEISYAYIHGNRSLDLQINNAFPPSYGSTLSKFLFIPIPRKIFDYKPDSMIEKYTKTFSFSDRSKGISWPINLFSEFFWNFRQLGFIFLYFFLIISNSLYYGFWNSVVKTKNHLFLPLGLFLLNQWIVLVRGSGIELFLLDFLIGLIFILPLMSLRPKINE